MKKIVFVFSIVLTLLITTLSFTYRQQSNSYTKLYNGRLDAFKSSQDELLDLVNSVNFNSTSEIEDLKKSVYRSRSQLKAIDLWLRYLEPIAYKKINGPLPVEWETEVFEKFEKPYRREGAGLTLAAIYLDEVKPEKDSLVKLIQASIFASQTFSADSITSQLSDPDHFYFCNRLFLLNLAAIYTTGFECPDSAKVIPELFDMLKATNGIYETFNESFPVFKQGQDYIDLYQKTIAFVKAEPKNYSSFDHFKFIRDYINPLFALNQVFINQYRVRSKSYIDYSLTRNNFSIFSKSLFSGQNDKGIFIRVEDEKALLEIDRLGKLLFFDPILSGNNKRSCNSCHRASEYFTDTITATSFAFNGNDKLARNAPSLINSKYNHLLMMDGAHISLQDQLKAVMIDPREMGSKEKEILSKVLSCKQYSDAFNSLLRLTPEEDHITLDHIISAVTFYYGKFSDHYAPFDEAMHAKKPLTKAAQKGFNLFMSKAQCATCHFLPTFSGMKPPYIGSEFEVLGVPADTGYKRPSPDKGRYVLNNAVETMNAFRTGNLRNAEYTKPYMHNGVFTSLEQVIDFYDGGGGVGHGLKLNNQTLSADSLRLTKEEKNLLITFIKSLNENIPSEMPPAKLPASSDPALNKRVVGGTM